MVWQWIAVVATPVIIAVLTLLLFWLFSTAKRHWGCLSKPLVSTFGLVCWVNTRIIVMLTYVLSGLCAAIAGIIVAADIRGADANNAGLWLELAALFSRW